MKKTIITAAANTAFARKHTTRRLLLSSCSVSGSFALRHHHQGLRSIGCFQSLLEKNNSNNNSSKRTFSDAAAPSAEDGILMKRNLPLPHDNNQEEHLQVTEKESNNNENVDAPFYTVLTLNQPTRFNPLSMDVLLRLQEELKIADEAFPKCRCVVVNAAPGKAFCAGHDMKEIHRNLQQQKVQQQQQQQYLSSTSADTPQDDGDDCNNNNNIQKLFDTCATVMESFRTIRPVTIAAVDGIATAAGCQLVAAVDLAICTQSSRFALSGIHNGLVCSTPIVPVSRSIRHHKQALELLLTGDFISADRALEYGLVNQVVDNDNEDNALHKATVDLVQRITRHSGFAVTRGKQLFYEQYDLNLHEAYTLATHRIVDDVVNSKDAFEGIAAFVEKRKPKWET